ncbi:hypothetical protein [Leptobacterium flavescens]|uniref:hypothetical protein n=1 Tax=Leptobacterium flavescens TaxID=472055 RepID=UPI00293BB8C7|nr:hypothetical protein [Leptobacterium flavescens]
MPKRYIALTLWPVIILKDEKLRCDPVLLNHEKIHLKQQLELLILPFYVLYLGEWLFRLCLYGDLHKAYKNISFEREAYQNETDMNYLQKRRAWSFLSYLRADV